MRMSPLKQYLWICSCLALAAWTAQVSAASLIPGGERAILGAVPGDQIFPQAAISTTGGFLVWTDNAVSDKGSRIMAQQLDAALTPIGAPITVSSAWKSKATGDQEKPEVALLPDGGAVVVWQGTTLSKRLQVRQIFARFIGPDGSLVKKDIRVNANRKLHHTDPAVAVLTDGTVVVVWTASDQDGDRKGVFARQYTSSGRAIGREFQVNQFTLNNQRDPAIAALADGRFVVAWITELQRAAASVDVCARIFNADGSPATGEFFVNPSSANPCASPAVAASPTGGFVVAWSQNELLVSTAGSGSGVAVLGSSARSTNSWDVFGRIYDSNNNPAPNIFRWNTRSYGDQYVPRVCAVGNTYAAVWTSLGQDGSWEGVFGQLVSKSGAFEGSELSVNTTTISRQLYPTIVSDGISRCLAIWTSYVVGGGNLDLYAQPYQLVE